MFVLARELQRVVEQIAECDPQPFLVRHHRRALHVDDHLGADPLDGVGHVGDQPFDELPTIDGTEALLAMLDPRILEQSIDQGGHAYRALSRSMM